MDGRGPARPPSGVQVKLGQYQAESIEVTEGEYVWYTEGAYSFSYVLEITDATGAVTTEAVTRSGDWGVVAPQSEEQLRAHLLDYYGPDRYEARWGSGDRSLPGDRLQLTLSSDEDGSVITAWSSGEVISFKQAGTLFVFWRRFEPETDG